MQVSEVIDANDDKCQNRVKFRKKKEINRQIALSYKSITFYSLKVPEKLLKLLWMWTLLWAALGNDVIVLFDIPSEEKR